MGRTLIDFAGVHGTRYAVYEAEQDGEGKIKLLKTIFKPHAAQIEFFSATERHGGMAASVVGMIAAALGYLPPLEGTILQEIIDLAAVSNAVRVALPTRAFAHF